MSDMTDIGGQFLSVIDRLCYNLSAWQIFKVAMCHEIVSFQEKT
jgi:hypothetical protein